MTDQGRRLRWSKIDGDEFYKNLMKEGRTLIDTCLDLAVDGHRLVEAFEAVADMVDGMLRSNATRKTVREPRWFDKECSKAHKELKDSLKMAIRDKDKIRQSRAKYKKAIKARKGALQKQAWADLRDAADRRDMADFWKIINRPCFQDAQAPEICTNILPEQWVTHFQVMYNHSGREVQGEEGGRRMVATTVFSLKEIEVGICGLTKNKAPGPDGIPPDLFLSNIPLWAPILTRVLNAAVRSGLPRSWSTAEIVPIYKKGCREDPQCYRPISLIDVSAKVLGRAVLNRLTEWAEEKKILVDVQYGFREGRSTTDQCLNLYLLTSKYISASDESVYLGFMDLSAAFDHVNREKLWVMMTRLGADQDLVHILRELHHNTSARVRYNAEGCTTESFFCKSGVRQGCILAPFLFSSYINGLDQALRLLKVDSPRIGARPIPVLLYADDAVLLARTPRGLQRLVDGFVHYMEDLDLAPNLNKSYVMEAGRKACRKFTYKIGTHTLGKVKSFNYLGLLIDEHLDFKGLIEGRGKKLVTSVGAIADFGRRVGYWSP